MKVKKRLVLTFPARLVREPVTTRLVKDHDLLINIMRARVDPNEEGLLVVEMSGEKKCVDTGLAYLDEIGVAVQPLEKDITWHAEKCTHCESCIEACRYDANKFNAKGEYQVFYHDCTFCMHCVAACPEHAITVDKKGFEKFQKGMALATEVVLGEFPPEAVFHINVLLQVTYLCDCWGFSTAALVPDVGIVASRDMVAVEKATLDMLDADEVLPNSLPKGRELEGEGHLFERIHHKDPFVQLRALERRGLGRQRYRLVEVN